MYDAGKVIFIMGPVGINVPGTSDVDSIIYVYLSGSQIPTLSGTVEGMTHVGNIANCNDTLWNKSSIKNPYVKIAYNGKITIGLPPLGRSCSFNLFINIMALKK